MFRISLHLDVVCDVCDNMRETELGFFLFDEIYTAPIYDRKIKTNFPVVINTTFCKN